MAAAPALHAAPAGVLAARVRHPRLLRLVLLQQEHLLLLLQLLLPQHLTHG